MTTARTREVSESEESRIIVKLQTLVSEKMVVLLIERGALRSEEQFLVKN